MFSLGSSMSIRTLHLVGSAALLQASFGPCTLGVDPRVLAGHRLACPHTCELPMHEAFICTCHFCVASAGQRNIFVATCHSAPAGKRSKKLSWFHEALQARCSLFMGLSLTPTHESPAMAEAGMKVRQVPLQMQDG